MITVFKFVMLVKEEAHLYAKHAEKWKRATQLKKKKKEMVYYQHETSVVLSFLS